jgi:signal transduction histidine kinase
MWQKFLGNIRKTSEHMRNLVDELLDVAAIETGRIDLHLTRTPLRELLESCADLHSPSAQAKGIELEVKPGTAEVEVTADRDRISQVLDNLVDNAIKFTHPGGTVRVLCEATPEAGIIKVEDTGQGLAEDEVDSLFKGSRLSARPTSGESSTGFGLVIVRRIVELHGGEVWATSRHGVGSTFGFSLPLFGASDGGTAADQQPAQS